MKTFRRIVCSLLLLTGACGVAKAELEPIVYMEFGYGFMKYKTDELPVFLTTYNAANNPAQPFTMKLGMARGAYVKFGAGIGGEVRCVLDITIYKTKTSPLEARFANGSGRDIWVEHRLSNSVVGIRFGGTKEVPVWAQLNINLGIQHSTIYSAYVFPDGSRSLGLEHTLNGAYTDFALCGGFGLSLGCRIAGPLGVSVTLNRIGNFERKKPEHHQYSDDNDVKPLSDPNFLPRDMGLYVTEPWNSTENSISNDFRGWQFTGGLVLSLGDWGK